MMSRDSEWHQDKGKISQPYVYTTEVVLRPFSGEKYTEQGAVLLPCISQVAQDDDKPCDKRDSFSSPDIKAT